MTDKERLEEMKGIISTWKTILSEGNFADVTSEEVELVEYVIQQAERVQELEKRNNELEYASKHNGELNEFLQKRKLPPSTLGRHVVEVVMEYVEELERDTADWEIEARTQYVINKRLENQNQRHKQVLEEIRFLALNKPGALTTLFGKIYDLADKELKGESE